MNYLSRPYQVEQPVQRGDLNVDFQVLNTLQTRYDANKAIVDQAISQYEMLRGLRDSDNEYIAAKITEAKAQLDSFGSMRLEHKSTMDSVLKTLQNVIKDPIVMDAVQSKAIYDNYNTEVSKMKEKNPEKYNNANYQYGLYKGGFQEYMQGKANKVGSLSYTPYTDLNKETLDKIKVIKDVKGKRFIETISPDGKYKIRKEIDGLTQNEINGYFGSMLTSQEISQLQINGWAKYGQPSTIGTAKKMYSDYHNQLIKNKEDNLLILQANANNKNLGEDKNRENLKASEQLKYEVDGLKKLDVNTLSSDEISYQLEKMGYVDSISNMAASEWSTTIDKNEVYYADQTLDISRQNLDISKQRLALDQEKFGLEKIKLGLEYAVDAAGNPLVDGVVAKSAKATELEDLTEEGAGAKSLTDEHNTAYNTILSTAQQFIQNAPKEDKENFLKYLKARGINENLQFDEGKGAGTSLANTVYQAFKDGEFDTTYRNYGEEMENSYSIKQQKAKDILTVRGEAYKTTFDKNSDNYIDFLKTASSDLRLSAQSDLAEDLVQGNMALSQNIENFAKKAGGWDKLKSYLNKNPKELSEFAELTEKTDNAYKGISPILKTALGFVNPLAATSSIFSGRTPLNLLDRNLKKDASEEIEKSIQEKTQTGLMTSVYSDFTFTNDKVKENVLKMIPNERVEGGGILDRDKNANLTFYKQGQNIILTQEQKGERGAVNLLKVELTPGDASYSEILKYVDVTPKSTIKADSTTDLPAVNVKLRSHTLDTQTRHKKEASVMSVMASNPNIAKAFIINPAALVTKEKASQAIDAVLEAKNIAPERVQSFKNTILQNINTYKLKPTSSQNIQATGYTFGLDTYKGDEFIMSTSLGTNELTKDLNYLIKTHPQIFILNQLLHEVNNNNIEDITSKL